MKFDSKIVLISGGTRGIGKATAVEFAKEGATLALIYRSDNASANNTLALLNGSGHRAYQCDISDAHAVKTTIEQIHKDYGQIDVLVNNAAVHKYHPIDKSTYNEWQAEWQKTINVNVIGTSNLTYCTAQKMMERKSGKIIFISSRGAFRGEPEMPAYGASKAAINAMAQSLAQKLAAYNIHIGVVAPGFVETDLTKEVLEGENGKAIKSQSPMNRVAKPEEVAHAILFFADPKSIWSTGAILDLNGASYLRT